MEQWTAQVLSWVTFTPQLIALVFVISLIGEAFLFSIPLVFELIFIFAGVNFSTGKLPLIDLLLLMTASLLGREAGALILFWLSRMSTNIFWKLVTRRYPKKNLIENTPFKFLRHLDAISPFGVALGRLLWLRIPLTLILGARRRLKTLVLGIAISSVIYESVYVGLGAIVGKTVDVDSPLIFLSMAIGLGLLYLIAFGSRIAIRKLKNRRKEKTFQNDTAHED